MPPPTGTCPPFLEDSGDGWVSLRACTNLQQIDRIVNKQRVAARLPAWAVIQKWNLNIVATLARPSGLQNKVSAEEMVLLRFAWPVKLETVNYFQLPEEVYQSSSDEDEDM